MFTRISVNSDWIELQACHDWLAEDSAAGAVVTFSGQVRRENLNDDVIALTLEHYPAMTEQVLEQLVVQARDRWPIERVQIHHRVGRLVPGEPIVFVGVSSAHRDAAFEAARYLMDQLKTKAPFWKKEETLTEARWLDVRETDLEAAKKWK